MIGMLIEHRAGEGIATLLDYISNDRLRSAAEEFRSGLESAHEAINATPP
jgi:hypothetical protein